MTEQTHRVVGALRLGELSVPEIARMLCLADWTVYRCIHRLVRRRRVREVGQQKYGRRVWALRA